MTSPPRPPSPPLLPLPLSPPTKYVDFLLEEIALHTFNVSLGGLLVSVLLKGHLCRIAHDINIHIVDENDGTKETGHELISSDQTLLLVGLIDLTSSRHCSIWETYK